MRKLFSSKFKDPLFIILTTFLTLVYYWKSLLGYFQGDEWYYFTRTLPLTHNTDWIFYIISGGFTTITSPHLTPLSFLLYFLSVAAFKLAYIPYAISALLLHICNVYLLFLLAKKIFPKKTFLPWIASVFFTVSSVHFQAIIWTMTYLWTVLSTTFVISSLYFFIVFLDNESPKKSKLLISMVFLIFAVLTKESAAMLFILIPLIFIMKRRFNLLKQFLLYFGSSILIYFIYYRFLQYAFTINTEPIVQSYPIDMVLYVFRGLTYPLKMFTEVFIPFRWILSFVENATPLAYPGYGAEKAVRGSDFLTFTQTAGSDMVIYLIAIIILFLILIGLKQNKNTYERTGVIIGTLIIILSALPLIAIATYSPGSGYVTFFDSRDIYLASVGGAILFAIGIVKLGNLFTTPTVLLLSRMKKGRSSLFLMHNATTIYVAIFIFTWAVLQYFSLQVDLNFYADLGSQRKTVLNKILRDVPKLGNKSVFLVESNTGYYGFGPIPPFQTNLGQILSINYYQKGNLSEYFMRNDFLTKHNLTGEGYTEIDGNGFGYFIDENHAIWDSVSGKRDPNNIYAFSWDGKNNILTNITDSIRKKAKNQANIVSKFDDWLTYTDPQQLFSLRYPRSMTLSERKPQSDNILEDITLDTGTQETDQIPDFYDGLYMRIQMVKKPELMDMFQFTSMQNTAEGKTVGPDYTSRVYTAIDGTTMTALFPIKSTYYTYFIPYATSDKVFVVHVVGADGLIKVDTEGKYIFSKTVDDILSTVLIVQKQ